MPESPEEHHESEQPLDEYELRLGAALRLAGDAYDADRHALVTGGTTRGRRMRMRRRAAVVAGAAGVALAGVSGALLVPWHGGSGPASAAASVGAAPRTAHATASPAPVTGAAMVRTLEKLLPKGTFAHVGSRGSDEEPTGFPYATVVYDDGKGAAGISVSLNRVVPGGTDARQAVTCPDKVAIPYDACTSRRLADGSVVMVFQGYEYPDRRVDTKRWTADLVTPTGQHVSVSEWNAAQEKDSPVTRSQPPLSAAQLTDFVAARAWRPLADAVPEDPHQAAEPAPESGGAPIVGTLAALLPKGVHVVTRSRKSEDDAGSYAYVVVDDGKGRSLVQINVQPDMSDVAGDLFGSGDETLADGTRVAQHQGPGDKGVAGVVMWTVDTLRTDGRRVVVSAFNSGTQHDAATRAAPALTMQQLRAIALSPQWLSAG
ncbi:hypothetical protein [Streptomyces mangrovisoli]|uniref:LigA protein n=1 Tax=Streptomyces mangrovisoli TaxID=1428628 RepID=A0A1J4NVB6_9ACTN|nr:hypothetical protein [Streptomyces mangrovisoli]OIJ65165.1 hypothetical protein WN71_025500 [Streptomyces mangrovisoli]